MKKLLILLFSLFFLYSPSVFADDLSNFQIEGMSIGDSLLDYMTEDEILKEIELGKGRYSYLKEQNKYAEVFLIKDFSTYDYLSFFVKNNSTNKYITDKDEKFVISGIRGILKYNDDFDGCMQKRNEISEVLSGKFPNADKSESREVHPTDPSGNSSVEGVWFNFDSGGFASIHCDDFDANFIMINNYSLGMTIQILNKDSTVWLRNIL